VNPSTSPLTNPYEPAGDFAAEAAALDAGRLEELDAWAAGMARHPQGGEWHKLGERRLAENQAGAQAQYAHAALLEAQGERAEAARLLVGLCERLAQAAAWPAVALVARRALRAEAGPPAARWLVHAADETGGEDERFEALIEAHEAAPGEARLAWRLSRQYEARGERESALDATGRALDALARRHDAEGMEEALLSLLDESDPAYLRLALPPLPLFAKGGEAERVAGFLELSWPALRAAGLAGATWQTLRAMLLDLAEPGGLVALVPEVVEAALPQGAAARALLEDAGYGADPAASWLPLFERLLPFVPGAYAEHGSWGVGRVSSLTREEVWVDFPGRPGHRMTLRGAHQALVPLDPEDLAVLAAWQTDRLAELRAADPVDLIVRALRRLGGDAAGADLKKLLVRYAVPETEWTAFWNAARSRLPADPRVDGSAAYRGLYRLIAAGPGAPAGAIEPAVPLPRFDRGADARQVLTTLRRFLAQHPDEAVRLAQERGSVLRAWRDDPALPWRERVGALLVLAIVADAESAAAAPAVLARALADGFDPRELPSGPEQRQTIEWGLASAEWEAAVRSGIAARFTDVKDLAFESLLARLGEGAGGFLTTLARRAVEWPDAALAVLERAYGVRAPARGAGAGPGGFPALDPWESACGLAELLESGPGPQRVKAGLPLLATDGPLALAAAAAVPGAETRARIERLLLGWRGSDRSLLPFLEWAETAGLADFAARVREKRHMAARAITANSGKVEAHELPRIFLTRATLLRLRREAKGLDQALRGEIPVAIQKARELGDLRENAEYESAKLKQRQTQARLAQLGARLANVSVIDDLDRPPGVAGLGTEVELELPDGGSRRLWILGEGDDRLGPEVVSYLAPLGRALLGKRPGDAVELPGDGAAHSAVVRAVRPRLPEPGDPAAGSAAPTAA